MVLNLETVSVVGPGGDWAIGSKLSILPRVLSVLNTVPMKKEGLVQVVEDVNDNVIVGGGVDIRSGELAIDENGLLGNAQGRDGAVGDVPNEEEIRVFTPDRPHCYTGEV